jgi:hypothetical protein
MANPWTANPREATARITCCRNGRQGGVVSPGEGHGGKTRDGVGRTKTRSYVIPPGYNRLPGALWARQSAAGRFFRPEGRTWSGDPRGTGSEQGSDVGPEGTRCLSASRTERVG